MGYHSLEYVRRSKFELLSEIEIKLKSTIIVRFYVASLKQSLHVNRLSILDKSSNRLVFKFIFLTNRYSE